MTPEEYEHLVAQVLRDEGWDARVTRINATSVWT